MDSCKVSLARRTTVNAFTIEVSAIAHAHRFDWLVICEIKGSVASGVGIWDISGEDTELVNEMG